MIEIKEKKVKLSALKVNPDNPRTITDKELDRLVKSLAEFPEMMQLREIVADENNIILGGNMRWQALKKSGAKECTVKIVKGLSDEQKREFIIRDNANYGEWNMDALANEWSDLPLADWGVDLPEDWLTPETGEPQDAEPQIDRAEELNKIWQVKPGDLWQIASHRLLCGDSTKSEDVARVMGGDKADMILNDPPYGMRLDTDYSKIKPTSDKHAKFEKAKGKTTNKNYASVIGDDIDYDPNPVINIFANVKEQFWFGADYYAEKLPRKNDGSWLVWDKRQNEGDEYNLDEMFGASFELCWSMTKHKRQIIRARFAGLFGTETQDTKKRLHPTQKAIEVPIWIIDKYSESNNIIVDCYIGSGTTMVACQNLNRKCRGIEISENYCAVILERMKTAFPELEIKRLE